MHQRFKVLAALASTLVLAACGAEPNAQQAAPQRRAPAPDSDVELLFTTVELSYQSGSLYRYQSKSGKLSLLRGGLSGDPAIFACGPDEAALFNRSATQANFSQATLRDEHWNLSQARPGPFAQGAPSSFVALEGAAPVLAFFAEQKLAQFSLETGRTHGPAWGHTGLEKAHGPDDAMYFSGLKRIELDGQDYVLAVRAGLKKTWPYEVDAGSAIYGFRVEAGTLKPLANGAPLARPRATLPQLMTHEDGTLLAFGPCAAESIAPGCRSAVEIFDAARLVAGPWPQPATPVRGAPSEWVGGIRQGRSTDGGFEVLMSTRKGPEDAKELVAFSYEETEQGWRETGRRTLYRYTHPLSSGAYLLDYDAVSGLTFVGDLLSTQRGMLAILDEDGHEKARLELPELPYQGALFH